MNKEYILAKTKKHQQYKGFLIEPALENFFTGRIWPQAKHPISTAKNRSVYKAWLF